MIIQFERHPQTGHFTHQSAIMNNSGFDFCFNDALSQLHFDPSCGSCTEVSSSSFDADESAPLGALVSMMVPVRRDASDYHLPLIQTIPRSIVEDIVDVYYYKGFFTFTSHSSLVGAHPLSITTKVRDVLLLASISSFEQSGESVGDHTQARRDLQVSLRYPSSFIYPSSLVLYRSGFNSVTGHCEGPVERLRGLDSSPSRKYDLEHTQLKKVVISVHVTYQLLYCLTQLSDTFGRYYLIHPSHWNKAQERMQLLSQLEHPLGSEPVGFFLRPEPECHPFPHEHHQEQDYQAFLYPRLWRYVVYFHWLMYHLHVVDDDGPNPSNPESHDQPSRESPHKVTDSDQQVRTHWIHYHERSISKRWVSALRRMGASDTYPHRYETNGCYKIIPQVSIGMNQQAWRVTGEPLPLYPDLSHYSAHLPEPPPSLLVPFTESVYQVPRSMVASVP